MKRLSWKYIAGLIDGEGCIDFQIGISRRADRHGTMKESIYITPRVRLALTEPSRFILDMLHTNHGGNVWESRRKNMNPAWQNAYYWQLENSRVRGFLQNLAPYLYIKKQQALFLIWVIDNLRGRQAKSKGYENIAEARQCARQELKAMKADPQRLSEAAAKKVLNVLQADAIVQAA